MIDLLIQGARVVDVHTDAQLDVAVTDGTIIAIGETLPHHAEQQIDGSGLVLLPGGIDPHVHFNEPGRTNWEGFETGSRALVKGGMTSFFDMPLNSTPPTTTVDAFDTKRQLADDLSVANAYLWGGLVPDNLDQLEGLAARDVIGFKAFMSNSGIDDFPAVDDYSLYEGMRIIAKTGKILAVHAENDAITAGYAAAARANGNTTPQDYLNSRPVIAELEAIQRAILFAEETGCKLHIVHVSTGRGVGMVVQARRRGVDVTCETCPHYLTLTETDVEQIGAAAKCAPPIRSQAAHDALWTHLIQHEHIDFITSDHSPAPMTLKESDNFFEVWGGIASCQSTISLLLTFGHYQQRPYQKILSLQRISALTSHNVAQRFGLQNKGRIAVGMDADLALWDIEATYTLTADDLAYQHKISPYIGMDLRGQVIKTWVMGKQVYG